MVVSKSGRKKDEYYYPVCFCESFCVWRDLVLQCRHPVYCYCQSFCVLPPTSRSGVTFLIKSAFVVIVTPLLHPHSTLILSLTGLCLWALQVCASDFGTYLPPHGSLRDNFILYINCFKKDRLRCAFCIFIFEVYLSYGVFKARLVTSCTYARRKIYTYTVLICMFQFASYYLCGY